MQAKAATRIYGTSLIAEFPQRPSASRYTPQVHPSMACFSWNSGWVTGIVFSMIGGTGIRFCSSWRSVLALALVGSLVLPSRHGTVRQRALPSFNPSLRRQASPPKAVYVEDATAGTTLYSFNPDERRSPASTTKLMTALVIANNTTDWQELVTADPTDILSVDDGESMVGLLDGDVLTVEQMMYGLMLPSGNDAAHAMARFIGAKLLAQEGGPAIHSNASFRK